jgi:hemerythrin
MEYQFSDELMLGVDQIDEQHRRIFQVTNQMLQARDRGQGEKRLFALLAFLNQYLRDHFTQEENYMIHYGYDRYQDHVAQHQAFAEKFAEFQESFQIEGPSLRLVVQLTRFLVDWLNQHIRNTDRAMVEFLKPRLQEVKKVSGEKIWRR